MPAAANPVVVAGLADEDSARPVLAQALDLTNRLKGTLVVTHVGLPPVPADAVLPASGMAGGAFVPVEGEVEEDRAARDEQAHLHEQWVRGVVGEVAAECNLSGVPWSYRPSFGDPGHTLAEIAANLGAYCVVVGSRGEGIRATLARLARPSVSRSVLRAREVPVLVVPHEMPSPPGPAAA